MSDYLDLRPSSRVELDFALREELSLLDLTDGILDDLVGLTAFSGRDRYAFAEAVRRRVLQYSFADAFLRAVYGAGWSLRREGHKVYAEERDGCE